MGWPPRGRRELSAPEAWARSRYRQQKPVDRLNLKAEVKSRSTGFDARTT